jgi:hypothetical protein
MVEDELPIEYELIKDTMALDLQVLDTKIETSMDNTHVKILMEDDPDVLDSCAWALAVFRSAIHAAGMRDPA